MVLLADRGFCGYALWDKAQATGADLLWRAGTNTTPRHVETLDDGTWIGYHPDKVGVDRSLRRASWPSLAARETYWYGGLTPMRVQVDRLVAEARSRCVDIAVSADLATDLVATWRHPTPTVVYVSADRLRNAILAGSLMSVR